MDNIFHLLEGLALVAKLVDDNVDVSEIPIDLPSNYFVMDYLEKQGIYNGNFVNFSIWAKDIVRRSIKIVQHNRGYPINDFMYVYWFIYNNIRLDLVEQGSGDDFSLELIYATGLLSAGKEITGENLDINHAIDDDINVSGRFLTLFGNCMYSSLTDLYKANCLGTIGNVYDANYTSEPNTYQILRAYRDSEQSFWRPYEHFPLLYLVLHNNSEIGLNTVGTDEFISDRSFYRTLLNQAPDCGPYKKYDTSGNVIFGDTWQQWSTPSRLVWPEERKAEKNLGEYAGLDYMLLFNLYFLSFSNQTKDLLSITESFISNQTVTGYSGQTDPLYRRY